MNTEFEIPKSWKVVTFEDVAEGKNAIVDGPFGSNLKTSDYIDDKVNGVPVLTTKNLEGDYSDSKVRFISKEKFETLKRSQVNPGDILVAKIGSIGKTGIYPKNARTAIIPANLLKFTVSKTVNFNYVFYYLNSRGLQNRIKKIATATAQPAFNVTKFRKLKIPIPSLPEQQAIVAKLEELFSELDNGKQQLQNAQQQLKVYRQSLLKWAFEGKLSEAWREKMGNFQSSSQLLEKIKYEREDILKLNGIKIKPIQSISEEEIKELPKLPNGSAWVKLGQILWSVKDGPHYSPKYQETGIPFISGGNIRTNGIDFKNVKYISQELHEELSKRCKPMKMDVLYTKGGTTGIAKVNDYDIDFNVWVHVAVLKAIPSINPYYLQYILNSNHCYKQSQKYTHGVGNQDLGLTRMILITLPIYSLEEQQYIVNELESKLTVCDKIEETISQSLQQAETLRQSILKKAFEGKLINYELR